MCARVFYLLLGLLFTWIAITVAAIQFLVWWQVLIVSAVTLVVEIQILRYLAKRAIGNLGNLAKGLFDTKSRVLRGATIQVHTVKPAEAPTTLLDAITNGDHFESEAERQEELDQYRARHWYEIETTLFPDAQQQGPMQHWDIDDLRLVPQGTKPVDPNGDDDESSESDLELHELKLVIDGSSTEPEGSKLTGPHRLRFVVGVPPGVNSLQFRYYFEQFGEIRLIRMIAH